MQHHMATYFGRKNNRWQKPIKRYKMKYSKLNGINDNDSISILSFGAFVSSLSLKSIVVAPNWIILEAFLIMSY